MLLTMLLEEHKAVRRLNERLEASRMAHQNDSPPGGKSPQTANTIPGSVDPGIGFDDDPNTGEGED
jgi:hypothetical protein